MPISPEAYETFRNWMNHSAAHICRVRKDIMKAYLKSLGADKIAALSTTDQNVLATALGLTIPGPVEFLTPPPAEMDLSAIEKRVLAKMQRYTGGTRTGRFESRPEAQEIPTGRTFSGDGSHSSHVHFQSGRQQVEEFRNRARADRRAREEAEDKALIEGRLWTVVVAYKRTKTVMEIWKGRMPEGAEGQFLHDNDDAAMTLDAATHIGTLSEARSHAVKHYVSNSFAKLTIKVKGVKE